MNFVASTREREEKSVEMELNHLYLFELFFALCYCVSSMPLRIYYNASKYK